MPRVRLPWRATPTEVLRGLRGRERLVGLVGGGWADEALVAYAPDRVLGPDEDPFDLDGPGWWIGSWGYPLRHLLEQVPAGAPNPQPMPAAAIARYPWVLRREHGTWYAEGDVGELPDPAPTHDQPYDLTPFRPDRSAAEHQDAVRRTLGHIHDGDVFQVNLTTALRAELTGDPLDLFCTGVDRLAPAHAAYVSWPGGAVASLSPELFLRRTGDEVVTSPIKGTAPRGATDEEDARLAADLTASAKDRAENVMIVDLMRNDLARVCRPGTVRAGDLRAEPHAVWHLVADVHGTLDTGRTDADLLRATFPPGSVTGAPKVRATELIAELEPCERQVYTGAVGVVGPDRLELNVAIRTFEVSAGAVTLGVGGGIVADSDPAAEWAECLVKARPLVDAVGGELAVPTPPAPMHRTTSRAEPLAPRRPARPLTAPARVLFVDNYDSFVHNLVDDARRLGAECVVVRNDEPDLAEAYLAGGFTHLVLSPGPGAPADAGACVELVRRLGGLTSVLGVCLGHQAIVEAYGGTVGPAPRVVHGQASWVHHDGTGPWAGLPDPLLMGRYHSLAAHDLPADLQVTATTDDGVVMGVQHRRHRVWGVQGHPESVLTEHGPTMLRNVLAL
ncbi:aminodeoxychorismate components I/II [Nocardioides mangrovicus]|uniref:Aminodeoxychorismate components I/II n=1 Tax=Nocardioides mangrovicus TaxID=2478913 RepID=A0A3L8P5F3_9ACTN|nr:chorismate-binding protein [Nocardioides mangrovicus]RLV50401.1 aminodeoxychorismate components I/II [Nocardioides mangrovicus]